MQIQYYKSAWGDIKNSPGWFGKLCLMALLSFIPIFGPIVVLGYAFGWAREIAWGAHEPMPERIFANEDGKMYRRGWFVLVLMFVAFLVPYIVMRVGNAMQGGGLFGLAANSHAAVSSIFFGLGMLVYIIGLVGVVLLGLMSLIGSMRISIYDRLSAGFQLGKIWKMLRRDTNGILRIFGMYVLVGLIVGIVLAIVYTMIMFIVVFAGIAGMAAGGYSFSSLQYLTDAQATAFAVRLIASAGVVGIFGMLIVMFLTYLASVFILMLGARAAGYWTMQFDVPHWRGQDDPMPFEVTPPYAGVPPVQPAPYDPAPPVQPAPYDPAPPTPLEAVPFAQIEPYEPTSPAQQVPFEPVPPAQQAPFESTSPAQFAPYAEVPPAQEEERS